MEGLYTIDCCQHPARLTEHTSVTNRYYRNIFVIDGNTLRLGYLKQGDDYPAGFGVALGVNVEVYRRVR
jgi:hypothetical protein